MASSNHSNSFKSSGSRRVLQEIINFGSPPQCCSQAALVALTQYHHILGFITLPFKNMAHKRSPQPQTQEAIEVFTLAKVDNNIFSQLNPV
jgi:hypothetical protein